MNAPKLDLPEPLERLNYYNSQRLEAVDFRLEQAYHMRVRRALNQALYSPGIGEGLEVTKDKNDPHAVIVSPGLALDALGREIILLEPRKIMACGTPRRPDGVTFGNYLVIAYREEKVAPQSDGCRVLGVYDNSVGACGGKRSAQQTNSCHGGCACGGGCGCGGGGGRGCSCGTTEAQAYAWGAPSRIRSEPMLMFQDAWPTESSGKILLAQVELDATCKVIGVKAGMRRYASASKPATVMPISLAGEKDIDEDNPKVLNFHVDGGYPESAKLYLRGAKFSSLFYTELGKHTHVLTATTAKVTKDLRHTHEVQTFKEKGAGGHNHVLHTEADGTTSLETADADYVPTTSFIEGVGDHDHALEELTLNSKLDEWEHNHAVTATAANAGVSDTASRTGAAYKWLKNMTVAFTTGPSSTDITAEILAQLSAADPGNWPELGDGTAGHALNKGTPVIDLRQISSIDLSPGAHALVFSVPAGCGGQVQYNLYVS